MDVTSGLENLGPQQELALRRRLGRWSCVHRGVSPQDFDDLYQDAWCKLLVGRRQGHRARSVEGVLRWAIGNVSIDAQRRRSRRRTTPLDAAPPELLVADDGAGPVAQAEAMEDARCVLQAIDVVTERQRQIILLADIADVPPGEVQRRLGISERTYQRDRSGALQAMAHRLGDLMDRGTGPAR